MDGFIKKITGVLSVISTGNAIIISRGATIEFVFKKPYFTAYISKSFVDLDSLIRQVGTAQLYHCVRKTILNEDD
ncbi:pickpocket protein 28-like [Aphis craccivora]|uniref:Pickpocket protein 28-like n=1 Tax=Aphis craccivora TaxID=307492 RepID=A0A6G0Y6A7_APHCR|nr:pickpocket protein 28-like [Aphis craccivora]